MKNRNRNVKQVPSQTEAQAATESGAFVDVEKIQREETKQDVKKTDEKQKG